MFVSHHKSSYMKKISNTNKTFMSKNIFKMDKLKMANPFSFFAVVIIGKPSNGKNSSYYGNWFYLIWPKSQPDINIDDRYIKVYYLNDKSFSNFVKKHFQFKFYLIQNLSNCYIFFLIYVFCNIKVMWELFCFLSIRNINLAVVVSICDT